MNTIILNFPNPCAESKKLSSMREETVGTFNFNTPIDEEQYRHLGYLFRATNLQFEIENHFKKTIDFNKFEKQVAVTVIHNDGRINQEIELDYYDRWNAWYVLRISKLGDPKFIEYNIQFYAGDIHVLNDSLGLGEDFSRGYSGSYSHFLPTLFEDIAKKLSLWFTQSFTQSVGLFLLHKNLLKRYTI